MKKPIPDKTIEVIVKALADLHGATGERGSLHIIGVRICDHCRNEDEEAFPYGVTDAQGRYWQDLCNDCFDALGCIYPDVEVQP